MTDVNRLQGFKGEEGSEGEPLKPEETLLLAVFGKTEKGKVKLSN